MKVIDLLNKIANGEEVPERIKWNDVIWEYNKEEKEYYSQRTEEAFFNDTSSVGFWLMAHLNDVVEIIEDKEDINIQSISELPEWGYDDDDIRRTINELVQAVKHLEKTKEDK